MNVYLAPPDTPSRALDRVAAAFAKYPHPGITLVANEQAADLVVLQVVGRRESILKKARQILDRGQSYSVIQYVQRSTKTPHTKWWIELWQSAQVVWSYLPLDEWAHEDHYGGSAFAFYQAPLGVESDIFTTRNLKRHITVMTSGRDWLTESVRECALAADAVGGVAVHLGAELRRDVACFSGLSDAALAILYNQCQYVSGLRRIEGFELPAAEGLLCGARPILFDREHYRRWHGTWAEYVTEGDRPAVIEQLVELFKQPVRPVTQQEREDAAWRFHWPNILHGFWERCLA